MSGLTALMASKKAVLAAVASVVNFALVKWGGQTVEEALILTSPLTVAVGAQGIADFGKARAETMAAMKDALPKAGLLLAIGLGTLCLPSCAADGSASVVGHAAITTSGGPCDIRWDGDTLLVIGSGDGIAEIYTKHNWFPILGPVVIHRGVVLLKSNSREYEAELQPGQPLPAWVQETGLLRPGEAEQLGLTFAADPEA